MIVAVLGNLRLAFKPKELRAGDRGPLGKAYRGLFLGTSFRSVTESPYFPSGQDRMAGPQTYGARVVKRLNA